MVPVAEPACVVQAERAEVERRVAARLAQVMHTDHQVRERGRGGGHRPGKGVAHAGWCVCQGPCR